MLCLVEWRQALITARCCPLAQAETASSRPDAKMKMQGQQASMDARLQSNPTYQNLGSDSSDEETLEYQLEF